MNAIELDMIEGKKGFIFFYVLLFINRNSTEIFSLKVDDQECLEQQKEKKISSLWILVWSHRLNVLLAHASCTFFGNHVWADDFEECTPNLQARVKFWTLKCLVTRGSAFLGLLKAPHMGSTIALQTMPKNIFYPEAAWNISTKG